MPTPSGANRAVISVKFEDILPRKATSKATQSTDVPTEPGSKRLSGLT
jgi:hypothetical protein